MIEVKKEGVLITKTDLEFESEGAESTVSYLMARLTVEKYNSTGMTPHGKVLVSSGNRSYSKNPSISQVKPYIECENGVNKFQNNVTHTGCNNFTSKMR